MWQVDAPLLCQQLVRDWCRWYCGASVTIFWSRQQFTEPSSSERPQESSTQGSSRGSACQTLAKIVCEGGQLLPIERMTSAPHLTRTIQRGSSNTSNVSCNADATPKATMSGARTSRVTYDFTAHGDESFVWPLDGLFQVSCGAGMKDFRHNLVFSSL